MNYAEAAQYENLLISKNTLLGEFANWAVQQSPYACPEGLETAIKNLSDALPMHDYDTVTNINVLRDIIKSTIITIPEVVAWNNRKNGRDGMGLSASRYGQPSPDDDFIDLDALTRNIAFAIWKDAAEFKIFNDKFDATYGKPAEGQQ
jgi:hypothetical protein